jgi:hypothetical protein
MNLAAALMKVGSVRPWSACVMEQVKGRGERQGEYDEAPI